MRLQRYLARAGIASRRHAETLIAAGTVSVNGRVVREMGVQVESGDRVVYDGAVVTLRAEATYLILNKPFRVMTTMRDPEGRRTIGDLLDERDIPRRIVPVGRLDYDTGGVLLLTDDGDLAHVLTHPSFGVEKTYRAVVRGRLGPDDVARMLAGIHLDDGRTAPAQIRIVAVRRESSTVDLTIHEGRNRQVRRTFETLGHPVTSLVRLRFGPIGLGTLAEGEIRGCTAREVHALRDVFAQAT